MKNIQQYVAKNARKIATDYCCETSPESITTEVTLQIRHNRLTLVSTGYAYWNPQDEEDSDIGFELATRRALDGLVAALREHESNKFEVVCTDAKYASRQIDNEGAVWDCYMLWQWNVTAMRRPHRPKGIRIIISG